MESKSEPELVNISKNRDKMHPQIDTEKRCRTEPPKNSLSVVRGALGCNFGPAGGRGFNLLVQF